MSRKLDPVDISVVLADPENPDSRAQITFRGDVNSLIESPDVMAGMLREALIRFEARSAYEEAVTPRLGGPIEVEEQPADMPWPLGT